MLKCKNEYITDEVKNSFKRDLVVMEGQIYINRSVTVYHSLYVSPAGLVFSVCMEQVPDINHLL